MDLDALELRVFRTDGTIVGVVGDVAPEEFEMQKLGQVRLLDMTGIRDGTYIKLATSYLVEVIERTCRWVANKFTR